MVSTATHTFSVLFVDTRDSWGYRLPAAPRLVGQARVARFQQRGRELRLKIGRSGANVVDEDHEIRGQPHLSPPGMGMHDLPNQTHLRERVNLEQDNG